MKLLSLLTVAIVLIGITTQAFACNYERMSRIPNYAKITTPKKILNVPNAHGICVAPNNAGKIYMYYSCAKLMKVVTLRGSLLNQHFCSLDKEIVACYRF